MFFLKVLFFSGYMVIIRSTDFKALKCIIYFFLFFIMIFLFFFSNITYFLYLTLLIFYIIIFFFPFFLFFQCLFFNQQILYPFFQYFSKSFLFSGSLVITRFTDFKALKNNISFFHIFPNDFFLPSFQSLHISYILQVFSLFFTINFLYHQFLFPISKIFKVLYLFFSQFFIKILSGFLNFLVSIKRCLNSFIKKHGSFESG